MQCLCLLWSTNMVKTSTTELDEIYISSHTDPAYDIRLIDFMPSIIGHPEYCDFVNISIFKAP